MNIKLTSVEARAKITECLDSGHVTVRFHAAERMFERKITHVQVMHALKAGVVTGPEWENNEWRHTVKAGKVGVVVALDAETEVVTVMWVSQ